MARCRSCGADIRWEDTAEGERIPLDPHEAPTGEHRWVIRESVVIPVSAEKDGLAYTDHRYTCPYGVGR